MDFDKTSAILHAVHKLCNCHQGEIEPFFAMLAQDGLVVCDCARKKFLELPRRCRQLNHKEDRRWDLGYRKGLAMGVGSCFTLLKTWTNHYKADRFSNHMTLEPL